MNAQPQHFAGGNVLLSYTAPSVLGGTGLKASNPISAGKCIDSVAQPLIVALDTPRLKDTCYYCYEMKQRSNVASGGDVTQTEGEQLKACSGCHIVKYCCKEHQKASWNECHKLECKIFAKLQPRILPHNVRAIMRAILLLQKRTIKRADWVKFEQLQSNVATFQAAGGEIYENLCLMARAVQEYSETNILGQQIVGMLARLMTNGFTLVTTTFDPIGVFLHPTLAMMNHSCDPNAYVRCDTNGAIEVIALKDVAQDEEILISYVDATFPTRVRQQELKARYFFDCHCSKCANAHDNDFPLNQLPPANVKKIFDTEAKVAVQLKSAGEDSGAEAPMQKLEYALKLLHNHGEWPLHRQPFPQARHAYMIALMAGGQYHAAFAQGVIQKLRVDPILLPETAHPIKMVHDWVLIRLIDCIQKGLEWADQRTALRDFDIASTDLRRIRAVVILDLWERVKELPDNGFRRMVGGVHGSLPIWDRILAGAHVTVAEIWGKMDRLMDAELKTEKERKYEW